MSDSRDNSIKQQKIAVLGAGSFGTALAILLAKNGNQTLLWGRDNQHLQDIQSQRTNQKYLPEIELPESLIIESDLEKAVSGAKDILMVTPSHTFATILNRIKPFTANQARIVWASKGLEPETNDFLEHCVVDIFGEQTPRAVLSGPTFAKELAKGMPTAITLASDNTEFATELSQRLVNQSFRVYLSNDLKGVQLAGALKNVIAIGTGISDGLGFGSNARTALITRGMAEMMRIGE
jgi:glycerol-3-phosphate dehydrogenase (NAD(P)+)